MSAWRATARAPRAQALLQETMTCLQPSKMQSLQETSILWNYLAINLRDDLRKKSMLTNGLPDWLLYGDLE